MSAGDDWPGGADWPRPRTIGEALTWLNAATDRAEAEAREDRPDPRALEHARRLRSAYFHAYQALRRKAAE